MKVFSWNDILLADKTDSYFTNSALTIGGFDGQHVGHKALCSRVLYYAKENKMLSGVITFEHSPRMLKEKSNYAGDISSLRLRLKIFENWGFDFVVVIDFSRDFSRMEGAIFLRILTDVCKMRFLTVGEGFRCGYKGETDTAQIERFAHENNIVFSIAPTINVQSHKISSSIIRKLVSLGDFAKCENLLGYPYSLDVQDAPMRFNLPQLAAFIERSSIQQILPPSGTYPVQVYKRNTSTPFSTVLTLDHNNLRLDVPQNLENTQFDVISFKSGQM